MGSLLVPLTPCLVVLLVCCQHETSIPSQGGPNPLEKEFVKTKSLKVSYSVVGKHKSVRITDAKEIKAILGAIEVSKTEQIYVPYVGNGRVELLDEKDDLIERLIFWKLDRLLVNRKDMGQIHLKSDKFYKKICEIASKAEGRPIDVLENNK